MFTELSRHGPFAASEREHQGRLRRHQAASHQRRNDKTNDKANIGKYGQSQRLPGNGLKQGVPLHTPANFLLAQQGQHALGQLVGLRHHGGASLLQDLGA